MPSTYDSLLRLELQAVGENSSTWGDKTNNNLELLADAIAGAVSINVAGSGNYTLTTANAADDQARNMFITLTGALTGTRNIIVPSSSKIYFIRNNTTGNFTVNIKTASGVAAVAPQGFTLAIACDGTDCYDASEVNRVARSGDTMTGPLLLPAGSSAAPALAQAAATSTGIAFPAAGQIDFISDATLKLRIGVSQNTSYQPLVLPAESPTTDNQATRKAYVDSQVSVVAAQIATVSAATSVNAAAITSANAVIAAVSARTSVNAVTIAAVSALTSVNAAAITSANAVIAAVSARTSVNAVAIAAVSAYASTVNAAAAKLGSNQTFSGTNTFTNAATFGSTVSVSALLYAPALTGGIVGAGGTLKTIGGGNNLGFSWDGANLFYNIDNAFNRAIVYSSDARIKTNLGEPEVDALALLDNLALHSYDFVEGLPPTFKEGHTRRVPLGVLAQDLELNGLGFLVNEVEQPETRPAALPPTLKAVNLAGLVPYLILAIRQLQAQLDEVKRGG